MLYIVTGPPAAGKTTWVQQHAKPGDIVIDYDLIAGVLTGPGADTHTHPKILRTVAYRARSAALNEALRHTATVDVYIIHTLPGEQARAKYAEHDAHVIVIDPGQDVVMQRIKEQRSPATVAVATRWYATRSDTPSTPVQASRTW